MHQFLKVVSLTSQHHNWVFLNALSITE